MGNESPNTLSENLLIMATELFFCYVRPDGTAIDVDKLQLSKEFKKFQVATSALKYVVILPHFLTHIQVDVSKLTINESISFFINIFNTLSIHALLTVGFPTSKLEWKYLGRSACYDIGILCSY